ncbi:MAG: 50S ribosomal protein L32 [bacterium]|nr:50S ribosomal protein L32 [bacterium]
MRHTKSHTNNRRSHHALKPGALSVCAKCNQAKLPHRICENCGTYNKREVIDVLAKLNKKEKKHKEKELRAQEEQEAGDKPMEAAELSKK